MSAVVAVEKKGGKESAKPNGQLTEDKTVTSQKMQNDKKELVDLYIPRKCSWTNRIITAQDRGAVQFRIAHVSKETGFAIKDSYTYVSLSGKIRARGEADMAVNELAKAVPGINV